MTKYSTIIINSFVMLTIVLMAVCNIPASAAILNVSEIFAANSFQTITISSGSVTSYMLDLQTGSYLQGGAGGFGGGGAGGRDTSTSTGVEKDYRNRVMGKQVIQYTYENTKLEFQYERVNGTKITGYILLTPSANPFVGDRVIHINENSFNSTTPYARAPLFNVVYAVNLYAVTVLDPGTNQQYFTIGEMVGGSGGSFTTWDNSTIANIPVTDMTKNPIYKCNFISINPFIITTYAVSIEDYTKSLATAVVTGVCTGNYWYCLLDWIFSPLKNAINELSKFAGDLKGFYDGTYAIASFIFSAQVIVGVSAFYTAIAILLSIEDSDDIFKAFGSFWRREMKLFRFYMEIFRAVKDMIKWW